MNKGIDILEQHLLGSTKYDQLIGFLHMNMGNDLLPLLEQAEKAGKKLTYDESKVPEGITDFFDPELITIV